MHGQNISIDCNKNYELEGNVAQITCNNGTFNKMPRCEPARCKELPSPPNNGMVVVSILLHSTLKSPKKVRFEKSQSQMAKKNFFSNARLLKKKIPIAITAQINVY